MKKIGIIGGMSWESTLLYYRIINEFISQKLGGLNSAKCILISVNFTEIKTLMDHGKWDKIALIMIDYAQILERAGADIILIGTNTVHAIANEIEKEIGISLLHIADATGEAIKDRNIKKIGLLGTRFTMEKNFYSDKLSDYGIKTIVPTKDERDFIDDVIFNQLCIGEINQSSKKKLLIIIESLAQKGAEGIVLGCTELPLIIEAEDIKIPLFDTTRIHAETAVNLALV
ncbi:MAG: aspartate/glutamate racemase family protein [Candidatus Pacebacteria bacterium]|nr:aspartate/glutamate racemase family protein [Candidatus Paceibacterota bacterium]